MIHIDCDSHILPHRVYRYVKPEFQSFLPKFHFDNDGRLTDVAVDIDPVTKTLNPKPFSSHNRVSGISNVEKRIEDLGKMGWNQQLLCPQELALRFNYSVEPELAAQMSASYNQVVAEILNQYSDYFFGVALIPLQNREASIEQLQYAIDHGFRGIYLDMMYLDRDQNLTRPIETLDYLSKLYYTCQEHSMVVYRHHMMHHSHFRRHPWFQSIAAFLPHDIELAILSTVNSKVFEQFPDLQMVFAEDAEPHAVLAIQKLQDFWAKTHNVTGNTDPMNFWTRNISVTVDIEHTESWQHLLSTIGSERLLLSSDYPHDDAAGRNKWNDIEDFKRLSLSTVDRENMAFRNAQKLFRL
jgi:predicted TIM-barrel fold metal-dependent hydrolase